MEQEESEVVRAPTVCVGVRETESRDVEVEARRRDVGRPPADDIVGAVGPAPVTVVHVLVGPFGRPHRTHGGR